MNLMGKKEFQQNMRLDKCVKYENLQIFRFLWVSSRFLIKPFLPKVKYFVSGSLND